MCRILSFSAFLFALLALTAIAPLPSFARQQTTTGVAGSDYSSPQFEYAISWDESWTVAGQSSEAGHDSLELDNGVSLLFVDGYATADDLRTCIQRRAGELAASEKISDFRPANGSAGLLSGGDTTQSWAVFDFTYDNGDTVADFRVMLQCFFVQPGVSQAVFADFIPASSYRQELGAYQAITATLTIPTPQQQTPVSPDDAPVTASTVVSDATYTSGTYGFRVSWDDTWEVQDEFNANGHAGVRISNGAAEILFDAFAADGSLAACLDTELGFIKDNPGVSNFVPALGTNNQPLGDSTSAAAWTVYNLDFTAAGATSEFSAYLRCVPLQDGAAQLLILHLAPAADFDDQVELRECVLATLEIDPN